MFPLRTAVVCTLLALVSLNGCASSRKKAPSGQDTRPLRLGQVALVNEEERFALIETIYPAPPAVGTTLRIYRGEAVAAELRATSVRRKPFLVADLVSGTPVKGDAVFQPRGENPQPPRTAPTTAPASPAPVTQVPPPKSGWRRWLGAFGIGH